MNIWLRCRLADGSVTWPDGGPYLDQPVQLITAFDIIAREWRRYDQVPG